MEKYESNSHRSRDQKQLDKKPVLNPEDIKVKSVVKQPGGMKKRSKFKEFLGSFIFNDKESIRTSIFGDLVVPLIKDAIYGMVGIILDGRIYGGRNDSRRRSGERVSYNRMYDDKGPERGYGARASFNYDEIIVRSIGDANAVFDEMEDTIEQYGFVSIAQAYEIAGIKETAPFSYHKWGWTTIKGAEPVRTRDGCYILKLPRPVTWD